MTDTFRALCAELVEALEEWARGQGTGVDAPLLTRARAALAQPEPEVLARVEFGDTEFNCPSDVVLSQYCDEWFFGNPRDEVDPVDLCRGAIKLFAQMPTPISVEERLPGPEECDAEGRCWLRGNVEGDWRLVDPSNTGVPQLKYCFSHWLPHHALPVPLP
jgi:hypothetical protein